MLLAALTACSQTKKEEVISDPEALYKEGLKSLGSDEYSTAADKFELLEKEHPASALAPDSQMYRAYTMYLDGKYDEAAAIIDNFTKQHPTHPALSYMLYLKGLCYYDQILDVGRDQELTHKSIAIFKVLIARFPESKYAKDAKLKIEYAFNLLAGKEMEVGRYYLSQNKHIAALNRFKVVVEKYDQTIFTPEALYRIIEVYYFLGDIKTASNYAQVLQYNYEDSEWAIRAQGLEGNTPSQSSGSFGEFFSNLW